MKKRKENRRKRNEKGGVNASIARLTSDGKLIRIVNDPKKLEKLGFMIQNGKIKEF